MYVCVFCLDLQLINFMYGLIWYRVKSIYLVYVVSKMNSKAYVRKINLTDTRLWRVQFTVHPLCSQCSSHEADLLCVTNQSDNELIVIHTHLKNCSVWRKSHSEFPFAFHSKWWHKSLISNSLENFFFYFKEQ